MLTKVDMAEKSGIKQDRVSQALKIMLETF